MENTEKNTNSTFQKTTDTLIKELETMSDAGLHDLFLVVYYLSAKDGYMVYGDKFDEFLGAFNRNPFKINEDKAFRKELIENITKYCYDHMNLLTAVLLLKKRFTVNEVINNYYTNMNVFGYDFF